MAEICLQIAEEISKSGEYFALVYSRSSHALSLESKSRHPLLDAFKFAQDVLFSELGASLSKTVFEGNIQIIPLKDALKELNCTTGSGSEKANEIEGCNVIAAPLRKGSEVLGMVIVGGAGLGHESSIPVELLSRIASMRLELLRSSSDEPEGAQDQKASFLRWLMDLIPGAVFYKNKDMRFEDCNSEFESVVGLPRESIIGKTVDEVLPNNARLIKEKDEELFLKGGIQTYELNIENGAGLKVFLTRKSIVLDTEGKLLGMVGVMVDISELKKTERFMSALIDSIPDPVFVVDKDRRVIAWNKAIEDLTGLPKDSIIGKKDQEYAVPFYGERRPLLLDLLFEEDARYERSYARLEKNKLSAVAEGYVQSTRGKLYVIGHASLVLDQAGNLLGGVETFKDITKHKEGEEALRQSEERYRAVVDDLTEAIVRFKPDGEITFVNRAFEQMMGATKESLLGRNVLDLMSEEERKEVVNLLGKANENPVARFTSREVKPDGNFLWIMWVGRAIFDSSGRIVEFQAAGVDITAIKRLEDDLKSLVEERTRKLQEAERLAAIGQIAASVGHDLRTPLQSIINNVYLLGILASDPRIPAEPSTEIRDLQKKIARQVEYMNGIISDIRDFSRNLVLETRPVLVPSLIQDALSLVTVPENVDLSLNVDVRDPVSVDQNMFTRVLVNLVANAIEAMPGGGTLQINARDCGEWVSFEVKDSGVGIPEEHLSKLFVPLFTTKSKGSGLGLAICKRIVEAHGGNIRVESRVGKGTSFFIELPKHANPKKSDIGKQN
ncbi:MAG: PAS domain S-box protein [Candidatus Methanosuratincola petrocarbonis]